jgi:hypothetical protein
LRTDVGDIVETARPNAAEPALVANPSPSTNPFHAPADAAEQSDLQAGESHGRALLA